MIDATANRRALEIEAAWLIHRDMDKARYLVQQHERVVLLGQEEYALLREKAVGCRGPLSWLLRERLSEAQNHRCCYCGRRSSRLTFEHIRPRSLGGLDHVDNLVMACGPCNSGRGNEYRAEHAEALAPDDAAAREPV